MVDIVIVNWNSNDYLQKCINSIFTKTNEKYVHKVIIIDNDSKDGSLDKIARNEKIHIIRNSENKGFAYACNQGFQLCHQSYVLLLNPDTQLYQDTLSACVGFMNEHPDIDVLGAQLIDDNGNIAPSCARFPTPGRLFSDALGLSKILPAVFPPAILMTGWNHSESRYVDQVMGAFMFMRPSVFEKTGYFDERFFVYFEELDFSKRLAKLGGKSFYNTNIRAIHTGEGTTQSVKAFRLYLNLKSRLQYSKKHFSRLGYFLVWITTYFIEPFSRSLLLLLQGKPAEIKNVFKAYQMLRQSGRI
jgi:GT2 family glycosyltransferase